MRPGRGDQPVNPCSCIAYSTSKKGVITWEMPQVELITQESGLHLKYESVWYSNLSKVKSRVYSIFVEFSN